MTDAEAQVILAAPDSHTLVQRLEAHAQMWRGAHGMMREHAWYVQEAADRIKELEAAQERSAVLTEALKPYCGAYSPYAALAAIEALAVSAATDAHRASLERQLAEYRARKPDDQTA